MPKISVIIPYHENETEHRALIGFFDELNDSDIEVISTTGKNRANAMNIGAQQAVNDYLWFVHADTKISQEHVNDLKLSLDKYPNRFHYFDLSYEKNNVFLNSIGANVRSRILGLPWGDQAFCLSKEIFMKLNAYNENAHYGEDHLLIWQAHQKKIKLKRVPMAVISSAREYQKQGWLRLTIKRQFLWIKQVFPEVFKLIKSRLKK